MVKNLDNEMGEQAIRLECEEKPNETITTHFLQKFCNAIARFTAHFIVKIRSFHCLLSNLGANCLLPLQKENSDVRNFQLAVVCKRPVSPQIGHQTFITIFTPTPS